MKLVSVTNHIHNNKKYKVARYEEGVEFVEKEMDMDEEVPETMNEPVQAKVVASPAKPVPQNNTAV